MCKLLMLPSLFLYFLLESYPDTTMLTTFPLSTPCQNHTPPTRTWFVKPRTPPIASPRPARASIRALVSISSTKSSKRGDTTSAGALNPNSSSSTNSTSMGVGAPTNIAAVAAAADPEMAPPICNL